MRAAIRRDQSHHAVNLCGFKTLFKIHIRQDRWKSFGQHRLSRARGTDHDDIVAPCSSHFQTTLHMLLAFHIIEINRIIHFRLEDLIEINFDWIDVKISI